MYPLLVACKSISNLRRAAAQEVVDQFRQHSGALVDQASSRLLVLIFVSIYESVSFNWANWWPLSFTPTTTKKKQAQLVSHELIRVAILWHEALEEASRLYFGEHNIEGMLKVLEPLHEMLEEGARKDNVTIQERAFIEVVPFSVLVFQPWV